jgi:predicted phosphatase
MASEDQTLEMLLSKFHTFTWCWEGKHHITVMAKCVKVARKQVLDVFDKIANLSAEVSKCDPESDRYIELTMDLRFLMPLDYHTEEDFMAYKPDTIVFVDDKEITLRDYIINYHPDCKKGGISKVRFS